MTRLPLSTDGGRFYEERSSKTCTERQSGPSPRSVIKPQQLATADTRFIANAFWLVIIRR
jgi:hypothetical protein